MLDEADIERARSRWDIIAADVPLKRRGRELAGNCPFHAEKTPSFYVAPDKGFYHCFGCGAHGNAIDFLMRQRSLDFVSAVREILGLPPQRAREASPAALPAPAEPDRDTASEVAEILAGCGPVTQATAASIYLWMRGLPARQPALLAHPALYCHELRQAMPAMVAPITSSAGVITAIQRFYLVPRVDFDSDGKGPTDNRAQVRARKKGLGRLQDGAVRLSPAGPRFGLAEGVETSIAAMALYRFPVWAACGATRFGFPAHWRQVGTPKGERPTLFVPPIEPPRGADVVWVEERAPTIWVPPEVQEIYIFGDDGFVGRAVATHAADWYSRHGLRSAAVFPAPGFDDFNSELRGSP